MDIQLIRKKLQTLYGNLVTTDWRKAPIDTKAFIAYIHKEDSIKKILAGLPKNSIDPDTWMKEMWQSGPSLPDDEDERVSFCLALLEKYQEDPQCAARSFHFSGTGLTEHVRGFIDFVLPPIYQFLDQELHAQEIARTPISNTSITANNVVMVQGHNYGTISQTNTKAIEIINELADKISSSDLEDDKKREAIANIDTIRSQLSSSSPNQAIIKLAWQVVAAAANISGATELASKVAPLLGI